MRNTFQYAGQYRGHSAQASAALTTQEKSIPAPIGGWDAINPLASMPVQNAVQLINFFPQPGWVELRWGHLKWCDTGTGLPVETVMGYMPQNSSLSKLMAASNGTIFDVTTSTASTLGGPYLSDRWQYTNFAGTGGSFLWMCDGFDIPQYWDGATLTVTTLTGPAGFVPADIISVTVYRQRLWLVQKNTTKAYYLELDSIDGAVSEFDVGNNFINGGYLQAIGTWSTDASDGPNEYISFISSQGDVAIYNILDPTDAGAISFRGRAEISQPVGWRCITKIGADLGIITLDGVLPLSQVLTYDKAALLGASITKNIRAAITESVRVAKDHFGWQLHSYPRNTMAILNVPIEEGSNQEQYVMNTITGAWGRFVGQYANCWEVFLDLPYFGDNDGFVRLADAAAGDEDQTLSADMQTAFHQYDLPVQKLFEMVRPNITIDETFPVDPQMGINVDFGTDAALDPIDFGSDITTSLWNVALWDVDLWNGQITSLSWASVAALGYYASIRITVDVPWTADLADPRHLKFNGFDTLFQGGGFI